MPYEYISYILNMFILIISLIVIIFLYKILLRTAKDLRCAITLLFITSIFFTVVHIIQFLCDINIITQILNEFIIKIIELIIILFTLISFICLYKTIMKTSEGKLRINGKLHINGKLKIKKKGKKRKKK